VVPQGLARLRRVLPGVMDDAANELPVRAQAGSAEVPERLWALEQRLATSDRRLARLAHQREAAQRLMPREGGGAATAPALERPLRS
jgi:hypothetical protein